jgi:chromosome segregation ATPase
MQSEPFRQPNETMTYANYANAPASYRDPDLESSTTTPSTQFPTAEILLGGYNRQTNGVENGSRPQRSTRVLDDPIATHLLVETALGDSVSYDILPYDELEALKREEQSLQNRINAVRKQLALEAKVRDAAKSLNRLYSSPSATSSPRLKRASSGLSNKEVLDKAEAQLAAATKKVDELSRELYNLEQRIRQTQMKLLQHTAGILQLTHGGSKDPSDMIYVPGGRPDSPASLDGYSRGFRREPDYDQGFSAGLTGLDGFLDELKSPTKPGGQMSKVGSREASRQKEAFLSVGKQLEDLNERMRDVLAHVNPEKAKSYTEIPRVDSENIDATVSQQIEKLSRGLEDIHLEHGSKSRSLVDAEMEDVQERNAELTVELQASLQESLSLEQQKNQLEDDVSSRMGNLNNDLYDFITATNPNNPIPSIPFNGGPAQLISYTEDRIETLKTIVQSLSSNSDQSAQYEVVLEGLWQIILAGEEDSRERKRAERQRLTAKRNAGEDLNSDDDLSPDEDNGLTEKFSLPAFSTKVQWLVSQLTYLKEKQSSLRRKVQQHRDVAATATARSADMPAVEDLRAQLERTNALHGTAKEELQDTESRLKKLQSTHSEKEVRIKSLERDLENAAQEARDEARLNSAEIEAKLQEAETRAASLQSQFTTMEQERETLVKTHSDQEQVFLKTETELRNLESEVVRLTTELTITKAELDAAYGSRSQRQADWAAAANSEASRRLEDATAKLEDAQLRNIELETTLDQMKQDKTRIEASSQKEDELRAELKETLKEFEDLAKASVEAEKERDDLEGQVDTLREKIGGLESALAEEKVKWLGMDGDRSSGTPAGSGQSTSALVLKNEFKKMMRDTRTEHMKSLRVSVFYHFPVSIHLESSFVHFVLTSCRLNKKNEDDSKP